LIADAAQTELNVGGDRFAGLHLDAAYDIRHALQPGDQAV